MREPKISDNALTVLEKRYLHRDDTGRVIETPGEMLMRVASAVASAERAHGADVDEWTERFYSVMADLDFLPNSPTLMNAGTPNGQLSACFVLPVGDSMEEIFGALSATALVHKSGGGTGFNFSHLRPEGDIVRSTSGVASGPISFMELFDHTTEVVKQGGTRRGANMGILSASHPDIIAFVREKLEGKKLTNFNISVGITDAFIDAVRRDGDWPLINPRTGETTRVIKASELWKMLTEGAWASGDPGVVFLDKIEAGNTVPGAGRLECTNPCGEQPLMPYESCNLGSINLAHFVTHDGEVDERRLESVVRTAVRFLDDVIDVNCSPLPEIERMTRANRKIGLGVMGWSDMLFAMGLRYGSRESFAAAERVMGIVQRAGHAESESLAQTRGVFPNWEQSTWGAQGRKMRNATVTTIAPTGTISLIADCSSGIEPAFALAFRRRAFDTDTLVYVNAHLENALARLGDRAAGVIDTVLETGTLASADVPSEMRDVFVTAHEIPFIEHIMMQAAFQRHTDNAVSKTINMANSATVQDIAEAYMTAYDSGCKGITVYRDRCRENQVLYSGAEQPAKDAPSEKSAPSLPRSRPAKIAGTTVKIRTSFGNLYLTLNSLEGKPFELFATLGKSGRDTQAHTEALGRLISLALRSGVSVRAVIEQLKGIGGSQPIFENDGLILSLPDAVAQGLEIALGETVEVSGSDMCPACGASTVHAEGCVRCPSCGYSKCL